MKCFTIFRMATAAAVIALLFVSTAAAAKPELTFTYNIAISGELVDGHNKLFQEKVAELSGGKISMQIVPNGTLGSAREVVEAVQLNSVNVAWSADSETDQVVGGMAWAWLPYMITSYEEADKYYNWGWISEELDKIMAKAGIAGIARSENGFRVLGKRGGKPVSSMADMKGLKVRVPQLYQYVEFYKRCGAMPTTITASESFTALQQGTVDAADNTIWNLYNFGFNELLTSITLLHYQYESAKIIANQDWWNSLTDGQRKIIGEAAQIASNYYRDGIRSREAKIIEEARAKGMVFVEPDEAFAKELRKVGMSMWEDARAKVPAEYIDRVFKEFGGK